MDHDTTDLSPARERIMCDRILKNATGFYDDPENVRAFEAWKENKNKENFNNASINHA